MIPKIKKNLKDLEENTNDAKSKARVVVSSVIIAYVFTKYDVHLETEKCDMLLKCLRLPASKEVCSEFMKSVDEFDDNVLRYDSLKLFKLFDEKERHIQLC